MSMTIKRRNPECGKLRRPVKRHKIADGIYSSTLLYLKFLMIWSLVLMLDFVLEFRFEYLWPFWLLVRSVYDSFKFQGLAFSVFFVCIAVTSDVICYLYIQNIPWLFFAASTYVWVQFVWQTDRGVCLPTFFLWLLFIYIEGYVRLRELKTDPVPFNFNLARPFAAHCIGYPVVTLGFGFKSYVSYKIRLRKQREVRKGNEFFSHLLTEALPQKVQPEEKEKEKALTAPTQEEASAAEQPPPPSKKGVTKNGAVDSKVIEKHKSLDDFEYIEQVLPKQNNIYDLEGENVEKEHRSTHSSKMEKSESIIKESSKLNTQKETNKKNKNNLAKENTANHFVNNKDEVISRLEGDLKRMRADLQYSRTCEQELRSQINSLMVEDKSMKSELHQLRQDNESLQVRLHNLVTSRQQDKQNVCALEKKLAEEKKSRSQAEQRLAAEHKAKKQEEAVAARAVALASVSRGDCSDVCKNRLRDLEGEMMQLRRELKIREEQLRQLEHEAQMLRQNKDAQNEAEVLMSALAAMQDKTTHLENSLSAETRVKLDLFSALGEAKRQIEIQQGMLVQKDKEITELKLRVGEVLALVPSNHVTPPLAINGEPGPFMSSPDTEDADVLMKSKLNPNASDYTPKTPN